VCPKCGERVRVERSFNNFVLVETIGVGGMGTVYKARDTLLDRFVALKLLRKDLGGGIDHTEQFRQEARVAASINHPNVIQVFSSGIDHDQFYLVMELVDHGSLDDFIEQRKRLPEEQVLEAGIQVAKGLRAAEAKGLIHRDVKPANILFADEHTAKISDFGLAGIAAEKAETPGEIWGTPYYVAPERLENQPEDFRSDIYGLGASLFHAVAGQAPIQGATNSAVALRKLKEKPLDLRRLAPDVSAATAGIFLRMIAPNPADRFSSYDDLVQELERAHTALVNKGHVSLPAARHGRWHIFAIAGIVLTAIAGFFLLGKMRERPGSAPVETAGMIPGSKLERQFTEARRQLLAGQHNVAQTEFARIAMDSKKRQPVYDWARLNEGFAALIGREQSRAQQAFQEVENAGETGFKKQDIDLARFLVATAKTMSAPGTVSASMVEGDNNFKNFALLLFALKDISQTDVKDAAQLLEQFMNTHPGGKFAWIADYKPLAGKYLDDCRLYSTWENGVQGNDPRTSLEKLHELKTQLKTQSAISDELSVEEKNLEKRVTDQQRTESVARDQGRRKKEAQLYSKRKARWLIEWKNKLIEDLNRAHYASGIVDLAGFSYAGIDSATRTTLKMRTPSGTMQISWRRLSPKTLLVISTSFIQPNAPDAADRQWLCAVFAAETGQRDTARQLAESAAKLKTEYRDLISAIAQQ
jgi:hypothetical protein